jgi:hypothetical protein
MSQKKKPDLRIPLAVSQHQQLAVAKGEFKFDDTESSTSVALKAIATPAVFANDATLCKLVADGNFDLLYAPDGGIQFHTVEHFVGFKRKMNKKNEEITTPAYKIKKSGHTDGGIALHLDFEGDTQEVPPMLEQDILSFKISPKAASDGSGIVGTDQKTLDKLVKKTKNAKESEKPPAPKPPTEVPAGGIKNAPTGTVAPTMPRAKTHETAQEPYEDWPLGDLKSAALYRQIDYPGGKKAKIDDLVRVLRAADEAEMGKDKKATPVEKEAPAEKEDILDDDEVEGYQD